MSKSSPCFIKSFSDISHPMHITSFSSQVIRDCSQENGLKELVSGNWLKETGQSQLKKLNSKAILSHKSRPPGLFNPFSGDLVGKKIRSCASGITVMPGRRNMHSVMDMWLVESRLHCPGWLQA